MLLSLPVASYFYFACPKEGKAHALSQPCVPVTKQKDSINRAYFMLEKAKPTYLRPSHRLK
jgi:hypothetical protein